jgi:recombination protein RecA
MAKIGLAALETALREKKLDRTLTSALPSLERTDAAALAPTDIAALDACLRGGLPRGQLSEIAGPGSSGRTSVLLTLLASATRRGEIAALVDTCDRLDVASAIAAQTDLDRFLWVRGAATGPIDRAIDRALKALNLVLQAGGFGVVALDLADVPLLALKGIPFTTWMRVQRIVEGSDTACVLVVPEPLARSAGGVTLMVTGKTAWAGDSDRSRRVDGLGVGIHVVSPRRKFEGDIRVRCRVGA